MSSNQHSDRTYSAQRTSSFGNFIKRTKSNDLLTERSGRASPGPGQLLREKSPETEGRPSIAASPPALPTLPSQPVIESFGGEDYVPAPIMSTSATNGQNGASSMTPGSFNAVDHTRAHSMTNRSRYSYAQSISSSLTSPRRVRRRRDPTPYK